MDKSVYYRANKQYLTIRHFYMQLTCYAMLYWLVSSKAPTNHIPKQKNNSYSKHWSENWNKINKKQ